MVKVSTVALIVKKLAYNLLLVLLVNQKETSVIQQRKSSY